MNKMDIQINYINLILYPSIIKAFKQKCFIKEKISLLLLHTYYQLQNIYGLLKMDILCLIVLNNKYIY